MLSRCAIASPASSSSWSRSTIRQLATLVHRHTPIIDCEHLIIGGGVIGLAVGAALVRNAVPSTRHASAISVLLIDKNMRIGDETSSRNSEVVHAGLYYPSDSLKERLCLRGKHLLYEYCRRHGVKYRMCGKWIVAAGNHGTNNDRGIGSTITTPSAYEEAYMAQLERKALALDIPLHRISQREIHALEPHLRVSAALSSPTSGIVDSHGLMQALEGELLAGRAGRESHIALQHRLVSVRRLDAAEALEGFRYEALVEDGHVKNGNANARSGNANAKSENTKSGNIQTITAATTSPTLLRIRARTVINSGGLWADDVAAMLKCEDGMKALLPQEVLDNYRTYPCRGHYYTYVNDDAHRRDGTSSTLLQQRQPQHNQMQSQHQHQHPRPLVSRLIYPLPPDPNLTHGLGIHCTVDLAGRLRLGPDADYECASKSDYRVDEEGTVEERARRERFWRAVERYLDIGDLERDGARMRVDYVGIRPKLQSPDAPAFRDFILNDETVHGAPGFINLVGLESPGLTASLAVGEEVARMLKVYND